MTAVDEASPLPSGEGQGEGCSDPAAPSSATSPVFPVFLKLAGRRVVLVGGGTVASAKLPALLAAGARVTVIAPSISPGITGVEAVHRREFTDADLDGAWYVVAAATPEINRSVARAAEARRVFVNAVDDTAHASAYLGGVIRREGVTLAISTDGAAPALAGLLREALEALLPENLSAWVREARARRAEWKEKRVPMAERRPLLLAALNRLYAQKEREP